MKIRAVELFSNVNEKSPSKLFPDWRIDTLILKLDWNDVLQYLDLARSFRLGIPSFQNAWIPVLSPATLFHSIPYDDHSNFWVNWLSQAERSDERKRVASIANLTKNRCTLPGMEKFPKNGVICATIFCKTFVVRRWSPPWRNTHRHEGVNFMPVLTAYSPTLA